MVVSGDSTRNEIGDQGQVVVDAVATAHRDLIDLFDLAVPASRPQIRLFRDVILAIPSTTSTASEATEAYTAAIYAYNASIEAVELAELLANPGRPGAAIGAVGLLGLCDPGVFGATGAPSGGPCLAWWIRRS